ncbi:hypothetical protein A2U01_0001571 [Trifolium medium]|uniref:Uncharacterized protein n=1 Tax=Trifolium medium TaxID=97028 RepID=A0A392M0F6_9FABA|nr:hypothetical protein [Trifolium medium]
MYGGRTVEEDKLLERSVVGGTTVKMRVEVDLWCGEDWLAAQLGDGAIMRE